MLRLLPVIISFLLLGAHFLRFGQSLLVIFSMLLPLILLFKQAWAARLMQFFLILGAVEWVRTLFFLVAVRRAHEQPWMRLVIILGMVALFTGCAALVFRYNSLKRRYKLG
jgi:hypothetical protein